MDIYFSLWACGILIIYFVALMATALLTGPTYPTFCPRWIWVTHVLWFFILFRTRSANFPGWARVTPRPWALCCTPPPAPSGPCLGMALPIRLPLSFSGFLPEISSPTALSKVAWFFLAQWYLFNQVSVTEDRFLFWKLWQFQNESFRTWLSCGGDDAVVTVRINLPKFRRLSCPFKPDIL